VISQTAGSVSQVLNSDPNGNSEPGHHNPGTPKLTPTNRPGKYTP
jgi:hypothetical protein